MLSFILRGYYVGCYFTEFIPYRLNYIYSSRVQVFEELKIWQLAVRVRCAYLY